MLISTSPVCPVRAFFLLSILLLLSACASPERSSRPLQQNKTPEELAEQFLTNRDFVAAARAFASLAGQETNPDPEYAGIAALLLQDTGGTARANAIIADAAQPTGRASTALLVAKARSMLETGFYEDAYVMLQGLDPESLRPYEVGAYRRSLGEAALKAGRSAEAAAALLNAAAYPLPGQVVTSLERSTWEAVSQLSPAENHKLSAQSTSPLAEGWYAFGALIDLGHLSESALDSGIDTWLARYSDHPARAFEKALRARAQAASAPVEHIALLLPFDSELAEASSAIRDGFITAWHTDLRPERPRVSVFSTSENAPVAAAEAAQASGADVIVGPLRKAEIKELLSRDTTGLPVLALNILDSVSSAKTGFYQFGLSPETEAQEVARYARSHGRRALVLGADSPWGERLITAYTQEWHHLEGELVTAATHGDSSESYSSAVKRALNVSLSEERSGRLKRKLGIKMHTESRRRQDIDVVLLAEHHSGARQLMPQLRYFQAGELPTFATSHVFAGNADAESDIDLDGITFGDIPWLFGKTDPATSGEVRALWPERYRGLGRLFALGIDAYRILPHLARMHFQPNMRVPGATGDLRMDSQGVMHRNMRWFRFHEGVPVSADLLL